MGGVCACDADEAQKPTNTESPDTKRPSRQRKGKPLTSYDALDGHSAEGTPEPSISRMEGDPYSFKHSNDEHKAAVSGYKDAVRTGHHEEVMQYVQEYLELDLFETPFGNEGNALHIAVKNQSYDLITYLLANGMAANEQNASDGNSPLHLAAMSRNLKVVSALASYMYDGDGDLENLNGDTPLSIAQRNGDLEIMELLEPNAVPIIKDHHSRISRISEHGDGLLPVYHREEDETNTPIIVEQESGSTIIRNDESIADQVADESDGDDDDEDYEEDGDEEDENSDIEYQEDSALSPEADELRSTLQLLYGPRSTLQQRVTAEHTLRVKCAAMDRSSMTQVEELAVSTTELPVLSGWLSKKSNYSSQTRWVFVKGSKILWTEREISDADLRANSPPKIKNSVGLLDITELVPVREGKKQRKFRFAVQSRGKAYVWKAGNEQERDHWVTALQKHTANMKGVMSYLKTRS